MFILEGPEKCVEDWGSLTCTGFTTVPRKANDFEQVSLHCADAATTKQHSAKASLLAAIDIGDSPQFTLQWDKAYLLPGGKYHFEWMRNGKLVAKSGAVDYRERDEDFLSTTNHDVPELLPIEKLQSMLLAAKTTRFSRFYNTVRRIFATFFHFFIYRAIWRFPQTAAMTVK